MMINLLSPSSSEAGLQALSIVLRTSTTLEVLQLQSCGLESRHVLPLASQLRSRGAQLRAAAELVEAGNLETAKELLTNLDEEQAQLRRPSSAPVLAPSAALAPLAESPRAEPTLGARRGLRDLELALLPPTSPSRPTAGAAEAGGLAPLPASVESPEARAAVESVAPHCRTRIEPLHGPTLPHQRTLPRRPPYFGWASRRVAPCACFPRAETAASSAASRAVVRLNHSATRLAFHEVYRLLRRMLASVSVSVLLWLSSCWAS